MAHTPGPWETWDRGQTWAIASEKEDHPDWMSGPGTYIVAEGITREANAHLIAAAPNLLEACKAALYGVVDRGGPDGLSQNEVVDYLTAAIAKAEPPGPQRR